MPAIYFSEAGKGHPIIFLHGFCDSHELWSEFINTFTENYRVITPDLPGFGKSGMLPSPFTIDHVADRLAGWFSEMKLVKPVVIGHSLGGYVALALLERYPKMFSGMVLFHSTAYADTAERKQVRNKVIAFVKSHGVAPFIETFVPGLFADKDHAAIPGTYKRTVETSLEVLVGYAAAMRDRPDRSGLLEMSTVKVLLIGGVQDSLVPIGDLRKLVLEAPKTLLFELPEAAHMGMFEAKNQAQNILSTYLGEVCTPDGT